MDLSSDLGSESMRLVESWTDEALTMKASRCHCCLVAVDILVQTLPIQWKVKSPVELVDCQQALIHFRKQEGPVKAESFINFNILFLIEALLFFYTYMWIRL